MTVSCRYKPDVGIPRLSSISVQSGSSKPGSGAVAGEEGGGAGCSDHCVI